VGSTILVQETDVCSAIEVHLVTTSHNRVHLARFICGEGHEHSLDNPGQNFGLDTNIIYLFHCF